MTYLAPLLLPAAFAGLMVWAGFTATRALRANPATSPEDPQRTEGQLATNLVNGRLDPANYRHAIASLVDNTGHVSTGVDMAVPTVTHGDRRAKLAPDPAVAPGWWTVQAFLDRVAANSPHRVFPVVSFDGRTAGEICLSDLTRLTREARIQTRIDKACRQLAAAPTAQPDDNLDRIVLGTTLRHGQDLLLIVQNEHVVGVISPHDIARVIELRALGQPVHRRTPT